MDSAARFSHRDVDFMKKLIFLFHRSVGLFSGLAIYRPYKHEAS